MCASNLEIPCYLWRWQRGGGVLVDGSALTMYYIVLLSLWTTSITTSTSHVAELRDLPQIASYSCKYYSSTAGVCNVVFLWRALWQQPEITLEQYLAKLVNTVGKKTLTRPQVDTNVEITVFAHPEFQQSETGDQ